MPLQKQPATLGHVLFISGLTVREPSAAGTCHMLWQQPRTGSWLPMLAT
jgi:hypothetical protein